MNWNEAIKALLIDPKVAITSQVESERSVEGYILVKTYKFIKKTNTADGESETILEIQTRPNNLSVHGISNNTALGARHVWASRSLFSYEPEYIEITKALALVDDQVEEEIISEQLVNIPASVLSKFEIAVRNRTKHETAKA